LLGGHLHVTAIWRFQRWFDSDPNPDSNSGPNSDSNPDSNSGPNSDSNSDNRASSYGEPCGGIDV